VSLNRPFGIRYDCCSEKNFSRFFASCLERLRQLLEDLGRGQMNYMLVVENETTLNTHECISTFDRHRNLAPIDARSLLPDLLKPDVTVGSVSVRLPSQSCFKSHRSLSSALDQTPVLRSLSLVVFPFLLGDSTFWATPLFLFFGVVVKDDSSRIGSALTM